MAVALTFDVVVLIKSATAALNTIKVIGTADVAQRTLGIWVAGVGTITLGRRIPWSPKQSFIIQQWESGQFPFLLATLQRTVTG